MVRLLIGRFGMLMIGLALTACVSQPMNSIDDGWVTLFDGSHLDNWVAVGKANWRVEDKLLQADKGNGHLVSKSSYGDFQIRAEFWVDEDANSGIFLRCADAQKPGSSTCYEVNIFDKRPGAEYGTGAIVNYAKVSPMPKAGGRWNIMEIAAKGPQLSVVLNGIATASVQDKTHARGPISLQYSAGIVKFRKVLIKSL